MLKPNSDTDFFWPVFWIHSSMGMLLWVACQTHHNAPYHGFPSIRKLMEFLVASRPQNRGSAGGYNELRLRSRNRRSCRTQPCRHAVWARTASAAAPRSFSEFTAFVCMVRLIHEVTISKEPKMMDLGPSFCEEFRYFGYFGGARKHVVHQLSHI